MWYNKGDECQKKYVLMDLLSEGGVLEEICTNGLRVSHDDNWCGFKKNLF